MVFISMSVNEDILPRFKVIRQQIRKYKDIPVNELSMCHAQSIIQELSAMNIHDYTDELSLRISCGCNLSKLIFKALQDKTQQKVRRSEFATAVKRRDYSICWLSGFTLGTEAAHIFPFTSCISDKQRYDINNGICLDPRVHKLWDTGYLICVPDDETRTVKFQVADMDNIIQKTEIENMIPQLASHENMIVSTEMFGYFKIRFQTDLANSLT